MGGQTHLELLIISGFFGSGKTTFIIRAAELLVRAKKKVAIIVNDIGEIGIDDKVISSYGLKVKELFGGCVCCQLGDDLVKTLKTVHRKFRPDIAIVEPSGAADPAQILATIRAAKDSNLKISPLVIMVDATQFQALLEEMPMVARKVSYADIVLINKIDAVKKNSLSAVQNEVRKLNNNATIFHISAETGGRVGEVVNSLIGR